MASRSTHLHSTKAKQGPRAYQDAQIQHIHRCCARSRTQTTAAAAGAAPTAHTMTCLPKTTPCTVCLSRVSQDMFWQTPPQKFPRTEKNKNKKTRKHEIVQRIIQFHFSAVMRNRLLLFSGEQKKRIFSTRPRRQTGSRRSATWQSGSCALSPVTPAAGIPCPSQAVCREKQKQWDDAQHGRSKIKLQGFMQQGRAYRNGRQQKTLRYLVDINTQKQNIRQSTC